MERKYRNGPLPTLKGDGKTSQKERNSFGRRAHFVKHTDYVDEQTLHDLLYIQMPSFTCNKIHFISRIHMRLIYRFLGKNSKKDFRFRQGKQRTFSLPFIAQYKSEMRMPKCHRFGTHTSSCLIGDQQQCSPIFFFISHLISSMIMPPSSIDSDDLLTFLDEW